MLLQALLALSAVFLIRKSLWIKASAKLLNVTYGNQRPYSIFWYGKNIFRRAITRQNNINL